MYNYELVGYFSSGDRTSNAVLGTVAINENDLSGGHRDEYLLGLARSKFGGTISKEENRINGQLTRVMASRKSRADDDGKKKKSGGGLGGWLKDQIMKPYKP